MTDLPQRTEPGSAQNSPAKAQYLLRFDDLCPTMDQARWRRFAEIFSRFGIQPILAVVPDNRDAQLEREAPDPNFWPEMRALQSAGACIGLHGYQHLCQARGRSLIPLHRTTEFAGAPESFQRAWIQAGLGILRRERLEPRIWVAPRHGFDRTTLTVLRDEGLRLVSDGFAEHPFAFRGMTWLPQQLWSPVEKTSGLWTICVHTNSATDETAGRLESFLTRFASQFTTVERVCAEWPIEPRSPADRVFHMLRLWRIRLAALRKRLVRHSG